MLSGGCQRPPRCGAHFVIAGVALVLLGQEFHRQTDAGELCARNFQTAGFFRPTRHDDGVVILLQAFKRHLHADFHRGTEFNAFRFHLDGTPVDQVLFHFEVRNAVAHQATDAVVLLKDRDGVARARQLLCARHACRPGPDDGDRLAGLLRRDKRRDPAFFPPAIHDLAFDRLDGDGRVINVQRAARLARGGADAAGEFREVVGRMQHFQRVAPVIFIDQIVPVRDDVVDRATIVAKRNPAIHAARCLPADRIFRHRNDEFAVVCQPLLGVGIGPVGPVEFEEASGLAHDQSPIILIIQPRQKQQRGALPPTASAHGHSHAA